LLPLPGELLQGGVESCGAMRFGRGFAAFVQGCRLDGHGRLDRQINMTDYSVKIDGPRL